MSNVAMANPKVPPSANPRFQPKYIPEITYPTPSPHNITGPSVGDNLEEADGDGEPDGMDMRAIYLVKKARIPLHLKVGIRVFKDRHLRWKHPWPYRPLIDRSMQIDP
jgi:hypothetical protein